MHNSNLNQDSRRSSAPNCWLVPLPRNSRFVGRISEIEYLEARLFQKDQCSRTAVMGLGGIGKTQVALELAYRIRDRFPDYSIFWVPALSFESVRQAYFGIARQLGIAQVGYEDEDIWGLVQSYLSQSDAKPWLLIIDNADDLELLFDNAGNNTEVFRLTNILPKSNGSSIVLTTRSRKSAVRFANSNIIHLSELDGNMAIELLNQSVINRIIFEENQVVMQLLSLLTFLPLAIVQAAAYINENDITVQDYLSLLHSQEDIVEILSEDFMDEGRYCDLQNPIATTWLISFEQIRTREPLASDYLSFMSCLDPKAIPKSLLPPAPTKKKGIDAFGLLSAYSFISQRPTESSFDLHRLVHLATRNWLNKQGMLSEWVEKAIKRLVEVFPNSNEENRTLWRSYIVHVHHVQASSEFQKSIRDYLPFLRRYERCLLKDGRWDEAEATLKQQVKVAECVLGIEHPFTLTCKTDLALTRGKRGYWEESIESLRQINAIQERVLEPGHMDVLTTVGNLAIFYSNMGLYKKAEEISVRVLSDYGPILGSENPHILECKYNLAVVYSLQGFYEKSVKLHHEVLNTREQALGSAHPNTLQSMSSLSFVYLNQGLILKAIDTGLQALKMKKVVLGQEHPDILINIQNLAVAHDFLNEQDSALMYGESLVDLSSRINGSCHPDTLRSLSVLAIIYISMGKWDRSENLLHEAREGLEKSVGIDHPDTMGAIFGLVAQYSMQNRLNEAEKLAVPLLEQRQKVVGPEHPGTLVVMNELANIWKSQGHVGKALELKDACLHLEERILGHKHHLTIACFNDRKKWREESIEDITSHRKRRMQSLAWSRSSATKLLNRKCIIVSRESDNFQVASEFWNYETERSNSPSPGKLTERNNQGLIPTKNKKPNEEEFCMDYDKRPSLDLDRADLQDDEASQSLPKALKWRGDAKLKSSKMRPQSGRNRAKVPPPAAPDPALIAALPKPPYAVPDPASVASPQDTDEISIREEIKPQKSTRITSSPLIVSSESYMKLHLPRANAGQSVQAPLNQPTQTLKHHSDVEPKAESSSSGVGYYGGFRSASIFSPITSSFSTLSCPPATSSSQTMRRSTAKHYSSTKNYSDLYRTEAPNRNSPPEHAKNALSKQSRTTAKHGLYGTNTDHYIPPKIAKDALSKPPRTRSKYAQQPKSYNRPKLRLQVQESSLATKEIPYRPAPYKSALAYWSFSGSPKARLILGNPEG